MWVNVHERKEPVMLTNDVVMTEVHSDLRLLTLPDAAEFLAVSRSALYSLMRTGQVVSVHIGRARRVPLSELEAFVRRTIET